MSIATLSENHRFEHYQRFEHDQRFEHYYRFENDQSDAGLLGSDHFGPEHEPVPPWLEAAPFRAHALHVMAVGALSEAALAVLVGVSARAVHHLVHGRRGRQVRKISPQIARRLFSLTPLEASIVRIRLVPADRACFHLVQLREAGWSIQRLADAMGITLDAAVALVDGRTAHCTQLVALRAAAEALARVSDSVLPPLPAGAYAA
jgi:plasmid maintenance system antidote protein VapI